MAISGGDGSIILNTKVDTSGLNSGLNSIKSSITKIGSAIGIAFGVGALVQFGKQAINLASDLQEVQNVVDVAFGDMSYKIEKFSKTAIEQFGISQLTAKRTASTYMAMGKGMGIVEDVASDMAITMTGLTADLASFYNMSQERADVILKSVYTGETETLKQLGIVMTEVNLQNFAMSKGITKNLSAMTQQEKTMLRYEYVLEQTALAQGDFARTQDSFANRTRVLSEKWKEMQSVFGETLIILADGLMPILEVVVQKLTIFALYLAAFAKGMTSAEEETEKLSEGTKDYGQNANKSANQTNRATAAIKNLGNETKKTNKQLAQFDELMILQSASANDMDADAFGGIFPTGFSENMDALGEFLDSDTLLKIQEFQEWVSENKGAIKTALEVAGILALAGSVASLLGKLGLLPGAFKKKDKGLDTQTPKIQTETASVLDLSSAFSLATLAILLKFVPALGKLPEKQEEVSTATVTATSNVEKQANAMDLASSAAVALATETEKLTESSNGVEPAILGVSRAISSVSEETKVASDNISVFGKGLEQAKEKSDELGTSLEGLNPKVKTQGENVSSTADDVRGFVGAAASYVDATNKMGESTENSNSYILRSYADMLEKTDKAIRAWGENTFYNIKEAWSKAAENLGLALKNMFDNIKNFFKGTEKGKDGVFAMENIPGYKTINMLDRLDQYLAAFTNSPVWRAAAFSFPTFGIPAFARGAVLPGGKPFLGILNDQPAGQTNIEAPLQTIVDAFNIALNSRGGVGGGNTEVVLEIDGREFGRAVVEQGNRENRRIGTRLVIA